MRDLSILPGQGRGSHWRGGQSGLAAPSAWRIGLALAVLIWPTTMSPQLKTISRWPRIERATLRAMRIGQHKPAPEQPSEKVNAA
jgi:hypothetical protein